MGTASPSIRRTGKKIVVPWRDLTPELAGPLVNTTDGFSPQKFGFFNFGKWFYWREWPAISFTVGEVALQSKIDADPAVDPKVGFKQLAGKLKDHKPVTVVIMGDSLSDGRHWSNKDSQWPKVLSAKIKEKYGSDVTIVNSSMGGTTLSQNMVVMPRWQHDTPSPDLVTVWFGNNDFDSGVRGPLFTKYLGLCVDRIRRQSQGNSAVMLITTNPTGDKWDSLNEMAQAVRDAAKQKQTGLADVSGEVHKLSVDDAVAQHYFAWDKTHLGDKGREVAADTVLKAIDEQVAATADAK